MLDIVQLNNEGFKIIVHVKTPDGAARDLTGAENLKIKLRAATAKQGHIFPASPENLETGAISCVVGPGAIDAIGEWQAQAYYELGSWKGHTHPEHAFYVEGNLA